MTTGTSSNADLGTDFSTSTDATSERRGSSGFPVRYLAVELRRFLRNRRALVFSVLMPLALYFSFASGQGAKDTWVGHGNVAAVIMVSMGFYGAVVAATSAGATVSVETAQGWVRTLALTPLRPSHYVLVKVVVGMVAGLVPVLVVTAAGALGGARADGPVWLWAPLLAWLGSSLFAALGLLVGLVVPSENVMQFLGLGLTVLAFAGSVFIPLGGWMLTAAQFTPMYGVGALSRWPLEGGELPWKALANAVVWAALFGGGAAWRFTRGTGRV